MPTPPSKAAPLRRILLVYGGRAGGRTEQLVGAVTQGVLSAGSEVTLMSRHALQCTADDLLVAEGLLLGTPEHFGYMSGALKDFFDRTYYPAEGKTSGLPYGLFVSAGNDGTGTVRAVERIATGYGWSAFSPPLIVIGETDKAALERASELGATLAYGLIAGIF